MRTRAKTYESLEYDRPAETVEGELTRRYVKSLDYWQHLIDGVPVNPSTIEEIPIANAFCPTGHRGGIANEDGSEEDKEW